jgi:hypothetical protein
MKWGLLVLYGIVLSFLYLVLMSRQAPYPPGWVATRDLAASALLQSGDVAPQGERHYLKRTIKKGQALRADDLVSAPDLAVKDGELPLAVPIARERVEDRSVNVGEPVRLCKDGKPIEPVTVRAVLCPPRVGACIAIAVLASTKAAELAEAFKTGPPPSLQSTRVTPACK